MVRLLVNGKPIVRQEKIIVDKQRPGFELLGGREAGVLVFVLWSATLIGILPLVLPLLSPHMITKATCVFSDPSSEL